MNWLDSPGSHFSPSRRILPSHFGTLTAAQPLLDVLKFAASL
jgi:hypothetical protein